MNLGALFSDNPQVVVPGWFLKMTGWFLQIYYFILLVLEVKILEKTLYFGKRIKKKNITIKKKIFRPNSLFPLPFSMVFLSFLWFCFNFPWRSSIFPRVFFSFQSGSSFFPRLCFNFCGLPRFCHIFLQFSMAFIDFPLFGSVSMFSMVYPWCCSLNVVLHVCILQNMPLVNV